MSAISHLGRLFAEKGVSHEPSASELWVLMRDEHVREAVTNLAKELKQAGIQFDVSE